MEGNKRNTARRFTLEEKAQIIVWHNEGKGYKYIMAQIPCSKSAIHYLVSAEARKKNKELVRKRRAKLKAETGFAHGKSEAMLCNQKDEYFALVRAVAEGPAYKKWEKVATDVG